MICLDCYAKLKGGISHHSYKIRVKYQANFNYNLQDLLKVLR